MDMPVTSEFDKTYELAVDQDRIKAILEGHKDKNFVQRIMQPDKYPTLPLDPSKGEGDYGTHMMSYSTNDKGAVVYPEIIQDTDGNLKRLGRDEAYRHAMKTGEYIPFSNPADADWFGKNYKKVWEK